MHTRLSPPPEFQYTSMVEILHHSTDDPLLKPGENLRRLLVYKLAPAFVRSGVVWDADQIREKLAKGPAERLLLALFVGSDDLVGIFLVHGKKGPLPYPGCGWRRTARS